MPCVLAVSVGERAFDRAQHRLVRGLVEHDLAAGDRVARRRPRRRPNRRRACAARRRSPRTRSEIVEHDDLVAARHERVDEVGADEAGAAGRPAPSWRRRYSEDPASVSGAPSRGAQCRGARCVAPTVVAPSVVARGCGPNPSGSGFRVGESGATRSGARISVEPRAARFLVGSGNPRSRRRCSSGSSGAEWCVGRSSSTDTAGEPAPGPRRPEVRRARRRRSYRAAGTGRADAHIRAAGSCSTRTRTPTQERPIAARGGFGTGAPRPAATWTTATESPVPAIVDRRRRRARRRRVPLPVRPRTTTATWRRVRGSRAWTRSGSSSFPVLITKPSVCTMRLPNFLHFAVGGSDRRACTWSKQSRPTHRR